MRNAVNSLFGRVLLILWMTKEKNRNFAQPRGYTLSRQIVEITFLLFLLLDQDNDSTFYNLSYITQFKPF